ncbi:MAG: DNA polymerase III subunit beta, partial [Planctomycetes bacterium]|nr:DNA polymerase III subunit beta [Planctomycetota bacterium]
IVIPTKIIGDILRESPDDTLRIEAEKNVLYVMGADSTYKVMGEDADQFPSIPEFPAGDSLEIPGSLLREMIKKTFFATAMESGRYALNGVLFAVEKTNVEMVSTDGRRLALIKRKAKNAASYVKSVILPKKGVGELLRIIQDDDENVLLRIEETQLIAKTKRATLCAQLVEGHFPDYREVIPGDSDKKIDFKRDQLLSAVRRAAILADEESKAVAMTFENDKLTLSSRSPEAGEDSVQMEVKYAGPKFVIGFNPDFLQDVLKAADDAETVKIEMKEANRAGVVKAGQDYVYVIMPLSLE